MGTFATLLSFHLPSDQTIDVFEKLDDALIPRNAERTGFRGLVCLEMDENTGRSQVFVVSLWDGASVKEAEDVVDRLSVAAAKVLGLGVTRRRARVLRAIPGPGEAFPTIGAPISVTQLLDVLVIEDEAAMAETSADVLRSAGLRIGAAATVEEALVVTGTGVVGSVVVDHEHAKSLLALGRDLPPVIVVSEPGTDALSELSVRDIEQLFACLSAPVARADLVRAVRAALGRREPGTKDEGAICQRTDDDQSPRAPALTPTTRKLKGRWSRRARSSRFGKG
jgi:CheY-like chemotaxis protein